jgi:competence protein ComEC
LSYFDVPPWHPAASLPVAALLTVAVLLRRQELAAMLTVVVALGLRTVPVNRIELHFFSIGQGDAALVRWPDGRNWLIDGGPPGRSLLEELRREGIDRLDEVILSHPHPDHLGGLLPVLEEMPVRTLRVPRLPKPGETDFATLMRMAPRWDVGLGFPEPSLELLHPSLSFRGPRDPVNDESLVVRLTFGRRRFLFLGDVEKAGEKALLQKGDLGADVMKVPHHGSRTSSSEALLAAVHPEIAVISCGWNNRFHHPSPEVEARYQNIRSFRTDRDGTVVIRSDGEDLEVHLEGQPGE